MTTNLVPLCSISPTYWTSRKAWDATSTWRKRTTSPTTGSRGSSSWSGRWTCAQAVSGHPENSWLSTGRRSGPYAYMMRARETALVASRSYTKDRHQERGLRLLTPPTTTSSRMFPPPSSSLGLESSRDTHRAVLARIRGLQTKLYLYLYEVILICSPLPP